MHSSIAVSVSAPERDPLRSPRLVLDDGKLTRLLLLHGGVFEGQQVAEGDLVTTYKTFTGRKIKEGEKSRLQAFEGLVIAIKHGKEAGATFTVRRVASGVGVIVSTTVGVGIMVSVGTA